MLKRAFLFLLIFISPLTSALGIEIERVALEAVESTSRSLKVSVVQYGIEPGIDFGAFSEKVEREVRLAKDSGAQLVVFPELITLEIGRAENQGGEAAHLRWIATEIAPRYRLNLAALAQKYEVSILGGSTPRWTEEGQLVNSVYLETPGGQEVVQDKIFPTAWEARNGIVGGDTVKVIDSALGAWVILICYDVEFPMISNLLAKESPELILVPSMTEGESGFSRVRWSAQARSVEHYAYTVVVGTVGGDSSWTNVGQGVFLTPHDTGWTGQIAEGIKGKTGQVFGELDFRKLCDRRATTKFYPARDQGGR